MAHKRKPRLFVGREVRFDPMKHLSFMGCESARGARVTGVVRYINRSHRWFLVEYSGLRTCFAFSDLGREVYMIGT